MPKRANETFQRFDGLDLTSSPHIIGPTKLWEAINVDLTIGGGVKARDQLRLITTLPATSCGLYPVANKLHTAVPAFTFTPGALDPSYNPNGAVAFDFIGDGTATLPAANPVVVVAEQWDANPYLLIERDDPTIKRRVYEHHYVQPDTSYAMTADGSNQLTLVSGLFGFTIPVGTIVYILGSAQAYVVQTSGDPTVILDAAVPITGTVLVVFKPNINTKVVLPFQPGGHILGYAKKIFANNIDTNDVWFSSTVNGPTDWTNSGDAGFLATSKYKTNGQTLRGFGLFNRRLAVMYDNTAQLWVVDPDPANMALTDTLQGAGTSQPGSIQNVRGELYYFSQGSFHSMGVVLYSGQVFDGDVGSKVSKLTQALDPQQFPRPLSVWSAHRSQYICAFGNTVFCYTNSPSVQRTGWTTWTLPWSISAICELNGQLYVRRADQPEVYVFDPAWTQEPGFTWSAGFGMWDAGDDDLIKMWRYMGLDLFDGPAQACLAYDPHDTSKRTSLVTVAGATFTIPLIQAHHAGPFFTGTGPCRIEKYTLRCDVGHVLF